MRSKAQTFLSGRHPGLRDVSSYSKLIKEDHFACATRMFEILFGPTPCGIGPQWIACYRPYTGRYQSNILVAPTIQFPKSKTVSRPNRPSQLFATERRMDPQKFAFAVCFQSRGGRCYRHIRGCQPCVENIFSRPSHLIQVRRKLIPVTGRRNTSVRSSVVNGCRKPFSYFSRIRKKPRKKCTFSISSPQMGFLRSLLVNASDARTSDLWSAFYL